MRAGTAGDAINPWSVRLFRTLETVRPRTAPEQTAYDTWRDQTSAREEARRDRVHRAARVIPTQLWIVLFFVAGVIFAFMLFFADRGERVVVQGMLIGSVIAVMAALLLLLRGLDQPFHDGVGGLQPTAMQRSLRMADEALRSIGAQVTIPCDAHGRPGRVMTTAGAHRPETSTTTESLRRQASRTTQRKPMWPVEVSTA